MKVNMHPRLTSLVIAVLALGLLPSFTSLSEGIASAIPSLSRFTGPVNILKLASPILMAYCWRERHQFNYQIKRLALVVLSAGSLFTVISILPCPSSSAILREWLVFVIGWLGALSFLSLSDMDRFRVVSVWAVWLYGSILIDLASPSLTQWLFSHVFDPNTRNLDFGEVGHRVLTGVFGRQSLAKLLAWLPWLWLFTALQAPLSLKMRRLLWIAFWSVLFISIPAILGTSQRGPYVAALVAVGIYGLHQTIQLKQKRSLIFASAMLLGTTVLTLVLVPRAIWEPRIRTLVGLHSAPNAIFSTQEKTAEDNKDFRIRMTRFSLNIITHNPLGRACIPEAEFRASESISAGHAHNMFLEQLRSKGWIWGGIHLALWLFAWLCAWKTPSMSGSALVAGISSVMVTGLTDHPWFVINHSLLLATYLVIAIAGSKNAKAIDHSL